MAEGKAMSDRQYPKCMSLKIFSFIPHVPS